MCYHGKFGRSASNGVPANRREPLKIGSVGPCSLFARAGLTPENTPLLYFCYPAKVLGQSVRK